MTLPHPVKAAHKNAPRKISFIFLLIHFTPLKISPVQRFDQQLCRRKVGSHWYVVHITELDNIVYIRLMPLGIERIAQKYEQIYLILLDLCSDLLHAAEMTCEMFVDIEVCDLLDQSSRCSGGK